MINDICMYNIIIFYDVSFRRKIHQMAGNKIFLIQIYLFHKHKHRAKVYLSNQLKEKIEKFFVPVWMAIMFQ